MASKRVLVTGGRWFNLSHAVHHVLGAIHNKHGIVALCEGGATGADELSKLWALTHNIPVETFEAPWKTFGNRAGNMRNSRMLREFKPDYAVAFPGGTGTGDMVRKLVEAGVPTFIGSYVAGTEEQEIAWRMVNG